MCSSQLPPSTGLSVLRDGTQHSAKVQVVDAPALDLDLLQTCAQVNHFAPDAVGISSTSVIWPSAAKLAPMLKERLAVPIFVGGPHPSTYPEHCLENPSVDVAVFGEGEETAVELVDRLAAGESLEGVCGVAWKEDGQVRRNEPRIPKGELDDAPLPAYHLLELERYSAPPMRVRQTPAVYMELFRGCAYAKCSYCTSAGSLKNRFRRHSPAIAAAQSTLGCSRSTGARGRGRTRRSPSGRARASRASRRRPSRARRRAP